MLKMAILKAKWSKMPDLVSQTDSGRKQREHSKSGGLSLNLDESTLELSYICFKQKAAAERTL